jgi:N-acylneuraminate cytidylyltransferase
MTILGLVPARGGSRGVPRKNVRLLAGEPLLVYTVREALRSRSVGRLVLSTDDAEIARVGRSCGAEVPFLRPPDLAGDAVPDWPVFDHALRWLEEHEGYRPDIVVQLRATSPLRTAAHIDQAVELLLADPAAHSVRSVTPAGQHPLKTWRISDGRLVPFVPAEVCGIDRAYNQPRQALPAAYVQNGALDVTRAEVIRDRRSMTGDVILPYVMDQEHSVNIDSPLDWELAEILMARRKAAAAGTAGGAAEPAGE